MRKLEEVLQDLSLIHIWKKLLSIFALSAPTSLRLSCPTRRLP